MITGSDAVGTELVDQAVVTHRAERCRPLMPPGAPSGAIAGALQAPGPCRAWAAGRLGPAPDLPGSAWGSPQWVVGDGAAHRQLLVREGLRGVAEWETDAGPLSPDELAAGEVLLDRLLSGGPHPTVRTA